MNKRSDTIAAISTPPGKSGIGIIRISGSKAFHIAQAITISKIKISSLINTKNRKLIHAYIIDKNKEKIDEVLLAIMPGNKSYTYEPTIEIHCHGGKAVLEKALKRVIQTGARPAEPGEFTRRAVENGRIDLVQAEAINDLINARTEKALKVAWRQVEGGLSKRCNQLKKEMIFVLSEIQAYIDFEINEEELKKDNWLISLEKSNAIIKSMIETSERNKYINNGCWVVLTGPPNSGKSSIFNNILNMERALVCEKPGTTRDHITETIEIEGIEVRLTDTAGIRNTKNKIEAASIEKALQIIKAADIVVYILDQTKNIDINEIKKIKKISTNIIILFNKSDLSVHNNVKKFIAKNKKDEIYCVSALNHNGIDNVMNCLAKKLSENFDNSIDPIITNIRQNILLKNAKEDLLSSIKNLKNNNFDIVIYELQKVVNRIKEIIGEIENEKILDLIFNKFCVGK